MGVEVLCCNVVAGGVAFLSYVGGDIVAFLRIRWAALAAVAIVITVIATMADNDGCDIDDEMMVMTIMFTMMVVVVMVMGMIRVMRLERDNPLVWQRSLVDAELDRMLDERERARIRAIQTATVPHKLKSVQRFPFTYRVSCVNLVIFVLSLHCNLVAIQSVVTVDAFPAAIRPCIVTV